MRARRKREESSIRVTLPPGDLERMLTARLEAYEPRQQRARRSSGRARVRFAALTALSALLLVFVGGAFAVHDEGFQLEGNVTEADTTYVDIDDVGPGQPELTAGDLCPGDNPGTPEDEDAFCGDFDWNSLFDATTNEIDQTANGFVDQDFVVDFRTSGTSFDTSDGSTFTQGGSKDDQDIPNWKCVEAANVGNKADIINAYATILETGSSRIFYFGVEKNEGNGDNNIGVWLFQGEVGCPDGADNATAFSGAHMPGDLLLVAENTNGGGIASIVAYEWVDDIDPGPAVVPGLDEADPVASGADCLDLGGDDTICATTNGEPIGVPWPHAGAIDDVNGLGGEYEPVSFIEGGINLAAFEEFQDACFTGFLINTRESQEVDSILVDFALGDIDTCKPDLSFDKEPEEQTHNVGDSFDWTLTVNNTGDGDADDALVSDTIPEGLTINSATVDPVSAGSCIISGQDVDCTVDVPAGGSVDIVINVTSTLDVFEADEGCVTVQNTGSVTDDEDESTGNDSDSADATICRPLVEKTADGHVTETHTWEVTKAVDPDHHDMNAGQTDSSDYDVTVNETIVESDTYVTGTISIENPGTVDMTVDVTDELSSGESAAVGDIDCDTNGDATADDDGDDVLVEAGETIECTYTIDTSDTDPGTNTATVTLNAIDFEATDGYTFSASVVGPTQVDVEDTFDGGAPEAIGTAIGDQLFEYDRDFTCPTDETLYDENGNYEFTKNNTVEILDGDTVLDDASASVTVDCWLPVPSKTADGAFDRDWDWTIDKVGDQTALLLAPGESFLVNYDVTLTPTSEDSDFLVAGTISIENPNPEDDMTVDVTDELSSLESAGVGDIDCDTNGDDVTDDDGDDVLVEAGETIECSYSIAHTNSPAATDTGTNTVTVTLEAGADDPQVTATDGYGFALDVETDECVDLSDSIYGDLGTVCVGGDLTVEYTIDVGQELCGPYEIDNIASFETNDNGETGSDNHVVTIDIPCDQGCTLTQGYWKTHSQYGPAPFDDNWDLLDAWYFDVVWINGDGSFTGADEPFFLSGQTWYEVFWTAPKGNAYYILAKQYMAAVLNGLNGADTTVVDDELAAAEALFTQYTPDQIAALKGQKAPRPEFISLAGTLGSYNEGDIGPGHCDVDFTASTAP